MDNKNECGCGCNEEKNVCDCTTQENEGCGCGCGCEEEEEKTIDLVLEDGSNLKCLVLGVFDVEDIPESEYIALLPQGHEEVFLYGFAESKDGVELSNIDDDDEFEAVSKRFMEIFEDED